MQARRPAWNLNVCSIALFVAGPFMWLAKTYPGLAPFALACACPLVRLAHRYYIKALGSLPAEDLARDLGARVLPPAS